ncbi:class II aldolase/adducin family protein [Sphingomonas abietis]|uniref:Class II aldolase/adducin family protein n=1 Tax=Sphingomonas abietis TaxID=3012344 RepID=A0ABY7NKN3_9SPHN|nr:class II aldolase/adducin family protein [Sphingomonas abietis]WBO21360.1 class II aldolase/adducin family protein [Sphingomonas abietis]
MATAAPAIPPTQPPRLPPKPAFASFAEERRDSQVRLVAAYRLFWKLGFDEGVMGHLSFRDPEFPDRFWLNPFGLSLGLIRTSDLMCIGLDGAVIAGDGFPHIGGVPLHSAIYRDRPEVMAIAHTHSPAGKAWSTLGRLIEPISTEAAVFFGRHGIYDSFAHGEGAALAAAANGNRAVIMKSHGILTVGESIDETAYLFASLEKVCAEQLRVEGLRPQHVPEEQARLISDRFSAYSGWLNFQPAFETILREQPDLAE